jgi:hypothetical protein
MNRNFIAFIGYMLALFSILLGLLLAGFEYVKNHSSFGQALVSTKLVQSDITATYTIGIYLCAAGVLVAALVLSYQVTCRDNSRSRDGLAEKISVDNSSDSDDEPEYEPIKLELGAVEYTSPPLSRPVQRFSSFRRRDEKLMIEEEEELPSYEEIRRYSSSSTSYSTATTSISATANDLP